MRLLKLTLAVFMTCLIVEGSQTVNADSKVNKVNKQLAKIRADEVKLKSMLAGLNPSQFDQVVSSHSSDEDSDEDSVPDVLERNQQNPTDVCDGSTDGHPDRDHREAKDKIFAIDGVNLVFNRDHVTRWALSISTVFEHGNTSNLIIGACVEASGHVNAADSNKIDVDQLEFKSAGECR